MVKKITGRKAAALALAVFMAFGARADSSREIRAPVWTYLETVPGNLSPDELKAKKPPIQELDSIARFVMGGMVYGWKFSYTPSDKTRNVAEYFTLSPVKEILSGDPRFSVVDLTPDYPRLTCWAVFTLDDSTKRWEKYWGSVLFRSSSGRGTGERMDEAKGVRKAYENAVMAAVRLYARGLEKNKPREIRGEVLLRENPRLFADQGYFVADIKVLINIQELVPYTKF